jgi:predicted Rossmann fold flavoprotein
MAEKRVIVIGGGPAGLIAAGRAAGAAGRAAQKGVRVLLVEKKKRPGRKLAITGKGRCNLTNVAEIADFIDHFGREGNFLRQAFSRFFNDDLVEFFEKIGLETVRERGGRVFPASGRAPEVVAVLLRWIEGLGVRIRHSSPVDALSIRDGRVTGVVAGGKKIACDAAILATGGASYPATGSTGDGYRLARDAGHTIVAVRPALVPLETAGKTAGRMADLNLRNIGVNLLINNRKKKEAFGEVVFATFGLTGPVILTLSGGVVDALGKGDRVTLSLDLKPALSEQKLDARLLREIAARGREQFRSLLRGLLPREMVPVCADLTGIPGRRPVSSLTATERNRLRAWLKDFRFDVTGHRPLSEAIVTAGGVSTREIDPRTMESRCTKGLYIAGELLDVQGDTGGYNLQAAFSTGWLAGQSAALGE